MRARKQTTVTAIALGLVAAAAGFARAAEDWPKWRGPRGDAISRETGLMEKWPKGGPKALWTKKVGGGYASPVAVAGKVYLFTFEGGKETLHAFDARTGDEAWAQTYAVTGSAPSYKGTRGTPTIEGDRIYTLGSAGDLTARNLADGKEIWRVNVLKQSGGQMLDWGAAASPLIVGDLIYVQSGGQGGPIALAVKKDDGQIAWKSEATGKAGYATIAYADESNGGPQLVVFGGEALWGMAPATGKTLWSVPFRTTYDVNAATPIIHEGKVFVSAEYNTGRGALFDLTTAKGGPPKKLWENPKVRCKFQPGVLEDGHLYVNSSGTLQCVKWEDGQVVWEGKDRDLRLGSGGSILRWGDKLVTLSEGGKLGLVKATPQGVQSISTVDLFDASQVWSSPLLYDGRLYALGGDEFVCLDVGGK